jgi:hypothetical protein
VGLAHHVAQRAVRRRRRPTARGNVTKVIVLLTDGDNTNDSYEQPQQGHYTGYGYAGQGRLLNASGQP